MRKQSGILRKQYAFLLIEINLIYFPHTAIGYGDCEDRREFGNPHQIYFSKLRQIFTW
ncbi:hypothetical protein [Fischerella sp. PCC 9605]|uniref:hypothetical protein n=1 Tax=Fischerella sp. PCC 9605 TaxID=1173024 RepID=UPI0018CBF279|nr:hypothetical protein [Fischerella sp. PCC 9605]